MERFLKRKERVEIDIDNLPADPGLRPSIWSYNSNDRERVRRAYILKGPHQPKCHNFPQTMIGNVLRRFSSKWFEDYPDWLEYSIQKDAAYCLYCYLFKSQGQVGTSQSGGDSFVTEGFKNWKKKEKLLTHVGEHNSAHNVARQKCEDLIKPQSKNVSTMWLTKDERNKREYKILLTAAVDCVRFLLRQGLSFRGHDESVESNNQGNYLELLHFLANHNEEVKKVAFENANSNLQLIAPKVQKELCEAAAAETLDFIMKDLGDSYFSIIVDESRDISMKEQLAVAIRYVDKKGQVIERFICIKHVSSTSAATIKTALESIFAKHSLSLQRIRGQAFDREKLVHLAELYPNDFSTIELVTLKYQLSTYIVDMRTNDEFSSLKGIGDLAKQLVKTKKDVVYSLVYRLIVLTLTLPVATATVERAFSAMKIVKHRLRSRMGDDWLNDCLVPYIEKEVFDLIPNEAVIQYYPTMQNRRISL